MTAPISVSQLLGRGHHRNADGRPRPGTKLRAEYDALRRGERIHPRNFGTPEILQSFYGMELRRGPAGFVELVGEWENGVFLSLDRILEISLAESDEEEGDENEG